MRGCYGICNFFLFSVFFTIASWGASNVNDSESFVLRGNVRPAVADGTAQDLGKLDAAQILPNMSLHFTMTAAQRADLDQLLEAQQNRRSPVYHKFLTPEGYAARFGLNDSDLARITLWLENRGFVDVQVARSRNWVSFSGMASQAEAAFQTSLHQFSLKNEIHFANATEPHLPKALQGLVESVGGLHNFRMRPHISRPEFTSGVSGNHYLAPDDWQTIYNVKPLYGAGFYGTGVTIAVVGQSDVSLGDIRAFRAAAGLPAKDPVFRIPPTDPDPGVKSNTGDEMESDLDIEWSGAIAQNADILFITSGSGVESSIKYAIDNNVAPILSTSYGNCERDAGSEVGVLNRLFQQAVAQGMTIVSAAGDWGAADCDGASGETTTTSGLQVDFPSSSPYVTGVGGTAFVSGDATYWGATNNGSNGSALSYMPEVVWNDGARSATGGGASLLVTVKPSWQVGPGVPADGLRDVPDIAFTASPGHDGYLICGDGSCTNGFADIHSNLYVIGGTSAGAPTFSGILALLLQKNGPGSRVGNINPNLYSLAQISGNVFHDITSGNNKVPCRVGTTDCPAGVAIGYTAGPGYDQTTGWGSIDAYNFAEQWSADIQLTASPTTLTIQPGASATSTVTVAPVNGFVGNVAFTCSVASTLVDVTCSVPSATVNTSGSTTVTITAASTARLPFWKRYQIPPLHPSWPLIFVCAVALRLLASQKKNSAYVCAAGMLFAVAIGSVSCGGSSSTPSPGGGTPTVTPLSLSCTLPTSAGTESAYNASCSAVGGTGPVEYSISSGALPAGLTLNSSTGVISGTPTTPGTYSFTLQATDASSPVKTAVQSVPTLVVANGTLSISCSLPSASVMRAYTGSCVATGGTAPVLYSISAGSLPAGLTLNSSSGAITGVPSTAGTSGFTVKAADSSSPTQITTTAVSNFAVSAISPLMITLTGNFSSAQVGVPFSGSCLAGGGNPPYTYSINAGVLPAGLTLNSSCAISGTPTTMETSSLTIRVTDSSTPQQTVTQSIAAFIVGPRPSESGLVTVTATSGGISNTVKISITVP